MARIQTAAISDEGRMPDGNGDLQGFGPASADTQDGVALRILATTDLHMKLLPHDYLSGHPCDRGSLA